MSRTQLFRGIPTEPEFLPSNGRGTKFNKPFNSTSYQQRRRSSSGDQKLHMTQQSWETWVRSLKLWNIDCYKQILQDNHIDTASMFNRSGLSHPREEDIKRSIEEAIVEKKNCCFNAARVKFVKMAVKMPDKEQVWLDFARLETECGEYKNALEIVTAALSKHANSEALFQKKISIEERLMKRDMILEDVTTLLSQDSTKMLKAILDGLVTLTRFGCEGKVLFMFKKLKEDKSSNLVSVKYLWFEMHCGKCADVMEKLPDVLNDNRNYNPLWFTSFALMEHYHELTWDRHDVMARVENSMYENWMTEAVAVLTNDIKWKLFIQRISCWCRALLDIMSLFGDQVLALAFDHL